MSIHVASVPNWFIQTVQEIFSKYNQGKIGYQSEGEEEVLWERHEQGQLGEARRKKGKGEVTQMHFNSKHLEILNP